MSVQRLRLISLPLLMSVLLVTLPPAPAAQADNTRAFTVGAQVMNTAADILSTIDPSEATLKRFGTGLGSAVLGISIGEAVSDVYNGEVTKGLETFSWAVGETAIGLTALGPLYALGKLATVGSTWATEKFYAYMTDDYYVQYKKARTDTLWPLLENPKRDQFLAWSKSGAGTFDAQWSMMWADKFARDRFIDLYREEYRSQFSWSERTIGFKLFSVFSQRAADYRKVMNEVPEQAALKQFIWRRWEAQVVTEGLQEAAEKIRALQAERNKGIFLVLTGRATGPDGKSIPADRVFVSALNNATLFSNMGAVAPASLRDPQRFALGASLDYLSGFDPKAKLTLRGGYGVLSEFTLGAILKPSLPVVKEAGVSYLIIDMGNLQTSDKKLTVTGQVRLRGAPVQEVKVIPVDPRVQDVTSTGAGLNLQLDAVPGKTVKVLLEVWDSVVSAYRDVTVQVPVPAQPGPVQLDVDVPVPEVLDATTDDAAIAALHQNFTLLLEGKITRAVYYQARNRLVGAHPTLAGLADQYESQIAALIDQELQYLRVQAEYFTAKTNDLKQKAATVADGVTDPLMALLDSEFLQDRTGKVDQYQQLRSRYAAMLDQAARYQAELQELQEQYSQALANSQQHYEVYMESLRGFAPMQYPPQTNTFMANVRMIEASLQPYLDQKQNGLLAEYDKRADRYQAKTELLLTRAAAMKDRVNASRARVATARSIAQPMITQHQAYRDKKLFDLTWGSGNLLGTLSGIMTERQKLKEGQPANTDWLTHYENRVPEFYAMASQMLDQMHSVLGLNYKSTFGADTLEGYMERVQPWLDFEAREWDRLAPVRECTTAMTEASSAQDGRFTGLDFPFGGDEDWYDYYNAFSEAEREQIKQTGQELGTLLGLAQQDIGDPKNEAETLEKWVAYLEGTGYTLKTAPAPEAPGQQPPDAGEPLPADSNIGPDKITFQVDSKVAWVKGRRVDLAAPVTVVSGRAMVPVRIIGEALGASVVWNQQYQEVRYIKGTLNVALRVGDRLVRVDDTNRSDRFFVDPTPMLTDGSTFVPVRVVSEALGATVQWIEETRQIVILVP